ncbi:hypothetical protein GCM10027294_29390 [Marinactinospora endophytica]
MEGGHHLTGQDALHPSLRAKRTGSALDDVDSEAAARRLLGRAVHVTAGVPHGRGDLGECNG